MLGSEDDDFVLTSPADQPTTKPSGKFRPSFGKLFNKRIVDGGKRFAAQSGPRPVKEKPRVKGGIRALQQLDAVIVSEPRKRRQVGNCDLIDGIHLIAVNRS